MSGIPGVERSFSLHRADVASRYMLTFHSEENEQAAGFCPDGISGIRRFLSVRSDHSEDRNERLFLPKLSEIYIYSSGVIFYYKG